jgi:hypothetical protein
MRFIAGTNAASVRRGHGGKPDRAASLDTKQTSGFSRVMRILLGIVWTLSLSLLCFLGFAWLVEAFNGDEMSGGFAGASLAVAWIVYRRWARTFLDGDR